MFAKSLLVGLVLAVCLTQFSEAIKCYKCTSTRDAFCGEDNFSKGKNPEIIDCTTAAPPHNLLNPKAPTKCSKVVLKDNAGMVVKRDCHWERVGDSTPGCFFDHSLKLEKCETCSDDLCNSAPKHVINIGIIATLVAIMKIFLY